VAVAVAAASLLRPVAVRIVKNSLAIGVPVFKKWLSSLRIDPDGLDTPVADAERGTWLTWLSSVSS
jgi:hypothetical protein